MIVAEITRDHIFEGDEANQLGRVFDSEALRQWWAWGITEGIPEDISFALAEANNGGKIPFKLFDDDGELYYEGWLISDDECLVQQFILAWAMSFAGCTTITVKVKDGNYIQEIG